MSKVVNLLTREQAQVIKEVTETLNSAAVDDRKAYQVWVTDQNGTSTHFVNREQFLEDTIEWCLSALGASFEFID